MSLVAAVFFVPIATIVMGAKAGVGVLLFCLLGAVAEANVSEALALDGSEENGYYVYDEEGNEIGWVENN